MAIERSHEKLPGDRDGEGDDKTGDHLASVCKEDKLDRGGRDTGAELPAFGSDKSEV